MPNLFADLFEIHDYGSDLVSSGRRIVATNFIDKVLFAQPDSPLLYWTGEGTARIVPGLPPSEYYRGVNVFQGHVVVWIGNRLKWSSQNDFTDWIPVGETAASFVFHLASNFTRPANGVVSDYVYVEESPLGLVSGQFIRIDANPSYDFFEVVDVLPVTEQIGDVSGFSQIVPVGATKAIFIGTAIPYKTGARLYFSGSDATLIVTEDAKATSSGTFVIASDFTVPAAGDTVEVEVTATPQVPAGSYVSIGPALYTGQDIYLVEAVNIAESKLTLRRTGVSVSSLDTHYAGEFVVTQPYVVVNNVSPVAATGNFLTKLKERFGFTVKPLDLSGSSAAGTVYAAGNEIFTVDANGAGETVNAGSSVNGEILHFDTLSDLGYIFKTRSIQSVQYTGVGNGTFFIRPEITDEGLIGAYSFVKVGEDKMFFWGHREIYQFGGGNQLIPIGQQHTKQVFGELDKAKANQIIGYHNEQDSEIWFIYPRKDQPDNGPLRVFIFNYLENSCTIDDYPTNLAALTAAGRLEWLNDIIWARAEGTWVAPGSWDVDATWDDLLADASENYTFIGTRDEPTVQEGPAMLVHGAGEYSRLGAAYESVYETIDFDAGDSLAWKYVDTVVLSLQVKNTIVGPKTLEVYVGTKKDFDDTISWSTAKTVRVEGDGNYTTKVNIQKSGKFFRVRIRSNTAGIQWRVSQMRILGRMGGLY